MVQFSTLLILLFFFYWTQLYTSVTVSTLQQSKSPIRVCALVAQLCPTLCDPMDCNPPYSSIRVILQAKLLEWVSMPFSRGLVPAQESNPGLLYCWWILYHLTTREACVCPVLGVSSPFRSPQGMDQSPLCYTAVLISCLFHMWYLECYMPIPISQFIPSPIPLWHPHACSLLLNLCFCFANKIMLFFDSFNKI